MVGGMDVESNFRSRWIEGVASKFGKLGGWVASPCGAAVGLVAGLALMGVLIPGLLS
jgi:hypothetical protein